MQPVDFERELMSAYMRQVGRSSIRPSLKTLRISVGYSLTLADEFEIADVMAGAADVGILRCLVGVQRHRPLDGVEKRLSVHDVPIFAERP